MSAKTEKTPNNAHKFFSLNGTYQVAPGTTSVDLHNDIGCWLESIHGTLDAIVMATEDKGQLGANPRTIALVLYGVIGQVRMVQGALLASYKLEAGA